MPPRPNWFIALPVRAADLPPGLVGEMPPGLRRMHPDDLHITVAFLGPVRPRAARAAWALATTIDEGPFRVESGALAAFGRPERPSAYGLDLGPGGAAVGAMIERWRNALLRAAAAREETRPVRPHITLGRPPRRGGTTIRARAHEWLATAAPAASALHLDRIALYTWPEDRRERLFRIVEQCTLPCARADSGEDEART